jgi:hypothetical protein
MHDDDDLTASAEPIRDWILGDGDPPALWRRSLLDIALRETEARRRELLRRPGARYNREWNAKIRHELRREQAEAMLCRLAIEAVFKEEGGDG